MNEIAFATDSQLRNIASTKANYDYATSPHRKTERKVANMLPVMDSFILGATTKGSLGTKAVSGGKELIDWGIFIGLANIYRKAVNGAVNNSESLQNFKENHPVAFNVSNALVGTAACLSGVYYIKKGYNKFIAPHISQKFKDMPKNIADQIDNSGIGRSINNGMKTFASKYPKITKGLKIGAIWALPVVCIGILATWISDMAKANNTKKSTLNELKAMRLASAQQLALENREE